MVKTEHPNILFIQADQLGAWALSTYGNTFAQTPNIASLGTQSTVFDNAYSPFPLCAPSRFGMMSGRTPSRIGAYDNACEFPAQTPTFAHYLRRAGYRTILSGKMHFVGPDQLHGFEERLTSDIYPGDFTWTEKIGEADENNKSTPRCITEAGPCGGSVQLDYDNEVVDRAEARITELVQHGDGPFMMTVSMTHPHDPYYCLPEHWNRYEGIDIPMPLFADYGPDDLDHLGRYICKRHGFDGTFSPETIARARRGYFGSVSYVDDQVGRLVALIDRLGIRDNTVIIFTSDHGEMLGERGMWFKRHFYEKSARVPLMISLPGQTTGTHRTENVSLIDLLPTLIDLSGQSTDMIVGPIEGRSLNGLLNGEGDAWDNVTYSETMSDGLAKPVFMVKRDHLKLIYGREQGTQLFDLQADPDEVDNKAGDPAYAETLSALMTELHAHWDDEALEAAIKLTIDQRVLIRDAHNHGATPDWDFVIPGEADGRWCRGGTNYSDWSLDVKPAKSA